MTSSLRLFTVSFSEQIITVSAFFLTSLTRIPSFCFSNSVYSGLVSKQPRWYVARHVYIGFQWLHSLTLKPLEFIFTKKAGWCHIVISVCVQIDSVLSLHCLWLVCDKSIQFFVLFVFSSVWVNKLVIQVYQRHRLYHRRWLAYWCVDLLPIENNHFLKLIRAEQSLWQLS